MASNGLNPKLRRYNETFLECRDQRHHRQRLGMYRFRDEHSGQRYIAVEYECLKCGRTNIDFLDPQSHEVLARSASYPRGYVFKYDPSEPHVTRTDVRDAVIKQSTVYGNREAMLSHREDRRG